MDILNEIIEVSNEIIDTLNKNNFFDENLFVEELALKRALQIKMQRKWEQEEEMMLNEAEFLEVCRSVHKNEIANTIEMLVDKGALNMSVNENGEIVYKANKDFNFKKLIDDEDEIQ